ncbi:MAG: hypothetical protein ABSA45_02305 [Verrucomicrobiota bacterium]
MGFCIPGNVLICVVVSALRGDLFEPPDCAMLRRGKQARRYTVPGKGQNRLTLAATRKSIAEQEQKTA